MQEKAENIPKSKVRQFTVTPPLVILFSALLLGGVIFKVFNMSFYQITFQGVGYLLYLIALFLPLVFLWFPAKAGKNVEKLPWYDWLLAVIAFGVPAYLFMHALDIQNEGWSAGTAPAVVKFMCLVFLVPVFEASRRVGGTPLFIICFCFAAFPLFAEYMPGPLAGISFPFSRTVTLHVLGGDSMLGMVMRVVGNIVIGYLMFGVAFKITGGGKFFIKLALSLLGKYRGGTAKVAILSSSFFGSISGSPVSNVITTGVITIPSMKEAGYPPYYAAAIEACASTGGTLMPPVMGSAAFFCAQFLGIPYYQVALAAFFPSLLYYIGLFVQTDCYAAKSNLKGLPREEVPTLRETLKEGWVFGVALVVIIFYIFMRQEARAPFYSTAILLILVNLQPSTRLNLASFKTILVESGRSIAEICGILLGVGFIVGSLSLTGVAHSFSFDVVLLAGNNLALLLILGALASFVLGMGMVSSAAYLFLALILAPAIIQIGIHPMSAHMFVMYCGMISFITPPVALSSIAAAGIADASPMKVGFKSMQLGLAIYLIPFALALNPALVGHGEVVDVVFSVMAAALGLVFISGATEAQLYTVGKLNSRWRFFLLIPGLLLLCPTWKLMAPGFVLGLLAYLFYRWQSKRHLDHEDAPELKPT